MKKSKSQKIGNYTNPQKVSAYYALVKNNDKNETNGVDNNILSYLKQILPKSLCDKNIVDLGCGDGRWSKYFALLNAKNVYGIDFSAEMIKRASYRLANTKNAHIIHGNIQNLPFRDSSIDIGFSSFSLMYFEDLNNIIQEIGRTLKDSGTLYIATNIINIDDTKLAQKLRGKSIPVDLGFNKKIPLENLVQPIEQYKEAFQNANFTIKIEKYFKPIGVEISKTYTYENALQLKKVLFVVQKNSK